MFRGPYEYRISRTEVTGAEWFEFVQAYAPYWQGGDFLSNFTSNLVVPTPSGYQLLAGAENKPVEVGWRFAARYCNWLSNNKALTQAAFENGAYDTSTFGDTPQGFTDQITHSPGARYWIPSLDELVKASHFDPDRYGPGQPGYWLYSTSSDAPPAWGPPGVGQSQPGSNILRDVASYRDVQSPWGLWDTSGGATEWTESTNSFPPHFPNPDGRLIEGSSWRYPGPIPDFDNDPRVPDRIDFFWSASPGVGRIGLRLAREIPSPLSAVVLFGAVPFFTRRRRTAHDTHRSDHGLCARPRRRDSFP